MKKITRRNFLKVAVVGGAAALAACSGETTSSTAASSTASSAAASSEATAEPVTLKFWKASIDDARKTFWEDMCAQYMVENPNIKIEFLGIPGMATDFDQKLDMAIAGKAEPDIISSFIKSTYIDRDLLECLEDYYESWEYIDLIDEKNFTALRSLDIAEGKRYGALTGGNVEVFYVRPDLLANVGMETIATWEDFFTAVEGLTDKDAGVYSYIIRGGSGSAMALAMEMFSYSGITDYFKDGKCTLNDPLHVEFLDRFFGGFGKYTSEEDVTKGWVEMSAQFQAAKSAVMIHNLGSALANYEAFGNDTGKVLAIPYPTGKTGKRVLPSSQPGGHMIMKSSAHKQEAWDFLGWLMETPQDSAYHEEMGNMPINSETLKESWVQDVSYFKMGADTMSDPNTQFCNVPYYLPDYSTAGANAEANIQAVLLGTMSAQEMLDAWAGELQASYDQVMG